MASKKQVLVGKVRVGGGAPISVQSMLTVPLDNRKGALAQTEKLRLAGCEIVRVAVPAHAVMKDLEHFAARSSLPVVADIHFDGRLAVEAIIVGCQKIRINPGNLQNPETLPEIVKLANEREIPIRVGLNSGSVVPRDGIKPEAADPISLLVKAAKAGVKQLEELGFDKIVVSAKCPDVPSTIATYRALAKTFPYPLHLGVTAAGGLRQAVAKHALAFGILLSEGIGDTVRVSITGDPVDEVRAAWDILRSLGLRKRGAVVVSCPTCGRTAVNLLSIVNEVEAALEELVSRVGEEKWPDDLRTVAVMGCIVNGPGEAAASDIGAAFEKKTAVIFRKGKVRERVPTGKAVKKLIRLIEEHTGGRA